MPVRPAPPRSRTPRKTASSAPAARRRTPPPPRAAGKTEAQPSKPLTATQKRYLRGLAHDLKPVILVGQKGITDTLLAELEGALSHHELIKVRLADDDRDARTEAIERILERTGAEQVQSIGKTATFYKRNPERAQFALPR